MPFDPTEPTSADLEVLRLLNRLEESEELYQFTLKMNRQIPFVADAAGNVLSIDPLWGQHMGAPITSALGLGFLDYVHPDDRPGLRDAWLHAMRSATEYHCDHRLHMKDGSYRWFRCRAKKFDRVTGSDSGWRGLLSDIDELFRARAAAEECGARFRRAAMATRDVIWESDLQTQTVIFNDTMRALFGHEQPEMPAPHSWWYERIHPDDRAFVRTSFASCPAGQRWFCEYRFRRADGEYAFVQARAFIEQNAEGRPVRATGALSDVTDERLNRQRVERLQSEMLDTSRSGAAAALAAMLAHEINQPLTSLTNYVRGAKRLISQNDPRARDRIVMAIDAAATNALEAGAIVQRMRDLVSRGEGRLSKQSLWQVAADVRTLTNHASSVGCVRIEIAADLGRHYVIADVVQTRQLFLNIVRNAVEALKEQQDAVVTISAVRADEFVCVTISDNGPGFGSTKPDALFAPFMTTKPNGVGLGLAICQMIVESNGGRIWAQENDGGGAAFHFTLPFSHTETGADED